MSPNQPASPAARMALVYITVGALMAIWTTVWYVYRTDHPPAGSGEHYWMGGFFATGMVLIVIGLGLGHIGRSARKADPPPEALVAAAPPVITTTAAEVPVTPPP